MPEELPAELAELRRMSITELRRRYVALFGKSPRAGHRLFLLKHVAWRLQEQSLGGLPTEVRQRLSELTNRLDPLAEMATKARSRAKVDPETKRNRRRRGRPREIRLPEPGTLIRRVYKGREIVVRVLETGFEYEGQRYRSLSAIAKTVTGAHWNGLLFFGLVSQKK